MDFELNKILGAILGTLLFVMGVGFVAEAIYSPATGGPGYALPEPADDTTSDDTGTPAPAVADIGTLLASADVAAGQGSAKKCQSCHDFTEGGPNKTGPNLYGVVGEKIADVEGYSFSDALKKLSDQTWTYENLNQWLTSPKAFAPGTKMTFAGIKDDQERANVIAYLGSLSHDPLPYPPPVAASSEASAPASEAPSEAPASTSSSEAPASAASSEAPASASSSEAPVSAESSEAPASEIAPSEVPVIAPGNDMSSSAPAASSSTAQ